MRRGAISSTRAATDWSLRQVSEALSGSGPCQTDPMEISGRSVCSQGHSDLAGALLAAASFEAVSGVATPGADASCASARADISTRAVPVTVPSPSPIDFMAISLKCAQSRAGPAGANARDQTFGRIVGGDRAAKEDNQEARHHLHGKEIEFFVEHEADRFHGIGERVIRADVV